VTAASAGNPGYATDGRGPNQAAGAGTGCPVFVNSAGVWCAVWSNVPVTA
jgi:hypothetical protein